MGINYFPAGTSGGGGGGAEWRVDVFNSTGTWTAPANTNFAYVTVAAGGGAGGTSYGANMPYGPSYNNSNFSINASNAGGSSSALGISSSGGAAGGNYAAKGFPGSTTYSSFTSSQPAQPGSSGGGGGNGFIQFNPGGNAGAPGVGAGFRSRDGQDGEIINAGVPVTSNQSYPIVVGSGGVTGNITWNAYYSPGVGNGSGGGSGRVTIEYYQ